MTGTDRAMWRVIAEGLAILYLRTGLAAGLILVVMLTLMRVVK